MMVRKGFRKITLLVVIFIAAAYAFSFVNIRTSNALSAKWVVQPTNEPIGIYDGDDGSNTITFKEVGKNIFTFADPKGKIIRRVEYQEMRYDPELMVYYVKIKGKWGFINQDGKFTLQPIYDSIDRYDSKLVKVHKDGKIAIVDANGKIKFGFFKGKDLSLPVDGLAGIQDASGKCGYINTKGQIVIPLKYGSVDDFSEGLAAVWVKNSWGYIDEKGKLVVPAKYSEAYPFHNGLATVAIQDRVKHPVKVSAVIDKQGKIIVPFDRGYNQISHYNKYGLTVFAIWRQTGTYAGFIDRTGKVVIPEHLENMASNQSGLENFVDSFDDDGLIVIGSDTPGWGIYDYTGKKILDGEMVSQVNSTDTHHFNQPLRCYARVIDGNLPVLANGAWQLVDLKGNLVSQEWYSTITVGPDKIYVTRHEDTYDLYGYADLKFNTIYPVVSWNAPLVKINPGVIMANINGYRFTDENGNYLDPDNSYGHWIATNKEMSTMITNNKISFVDSKTGKLALKTNYEYAKGFHNGICPIGIKDKWGYIDLKGNIVVPIIYDDADMGNDYLLPVKLNGKWGLIENPLKNKK